MRAVSSVKIQFFSHHCDIGNDVLISDAKLCANSGHDDTSTHVFQTENL